MINLQGEVENSCRKVCKLLPDCTLSYPKKQYCVYCTCCLIWYPVHEEYKYNLIFFMHIFNHNYVFIRSCNQSLFHTVTITYLFANSQEENHSAAASHSLSRSLPLP